LSALVFAAQSPYPGRQNVVNSRNVMRNAKPKIFENNGNSAIRGGVKKFIEFILTK
jgi:hypothetical protein